MQSTILRFDKSNKVFEVDGLATHIFFDHIPKCGGTSFGHLLERYFPVDRIFPYYWAGTLKELKPDIHLYARGHFYGDEVRKVPTCYHKITMLREPLSRVVSNYENWADSSRHDPNYLESAKEFPEVADALELAVKSSAEEFFASDNPTILFMTENYVTRHFQSIDSGEVMCAAHVDSALNNLQEYLGFGLLEHFEQSVMMLAVQLGIMPPPAGTITTLNKNRKAGRGRLSEAAMSSIAQRNELDLQLYAKARNIFLRRSIEIMDFLAGHYCRSRKRGVNDRCTHLVRISASQLDESSWWFLEHSSEAIPYRWTGFSAAARVEFQLVSNIVSKLRVKVVCLNDSVSVSNAESVQLWMLGKSCIPEVSLANGLLVIDAEFNIDRPLRSKNVFFEIRSKTISIKDVDDEYRDVGLAVQEIAVEIEFAEEK